jgi:YidC/Oxa1 family membrane protein insertase
MVLMIGILVITNLLFPPTPPAPAPESSGLDSAVAVPREAEGAPSQAAGAKPEAPGGQAAAELAPRPSGDPAIPGAGGVREVEVPRETERSIRVEGPLYAYTFSDRGARLVSARLLRFPSFTFDGSVELVHPEGGGVLGTRILVGRDTLDLRDVPFEVEPAEGLDLAEGGGAGKLRFSYQHPTHPFGYQVEYTFQPDQYLVEVSGRVSGLDASVLFTELGTGIPFNEQREQEEARASAYVLNHLQEGIRARPLNRVEGEQVEEGPLHWVAFKSKYFVLGLLAGSGEGEAHLGGAIARGAGGGYQADLSVSLPLGSGGGFAYRVFLGPQEYATLSNLGADMEEVNPYGWRFFRPVIRPFVGIIMAVLSFLHEKLSLGYGWVLIIFGVLMRVVLYPLNQKAMKAQLKNMAVQPLLQEIQTKYKDNPEKLQKEMMKLYKEHGFNPLAGCLPMLLPWPVLIALFFVFQNTIELRGVPFLWLPDLSGPDPYYILPLFLGVSMFLLQWVSMRSMPQTNPQMKMMMWMMPIMMVFIFFNLASGLNLYYSTANIATLPQQILIARERQKAQGRPPLTLGK